MNPIRLTPAQLDAALADRRAGKTAARPPTVTLASTRPLALLCRAAHGDAMCLLERGHRGRHVGRLSAAAVADWDDQP